MDFSSRRRTLTTNASIWTAAELGDVDRVRKVVVVKGRSPDALDPHGYTPLHLAAQSKHLRVPLILSLHCCSPPQTTAAPSIIRVCVLTAVIADQETRGIRKLQLWQLELLLLYYSRYQFLYVCASRRESVARWIGGYQNRPEMWKSAAVHY